MTTPDMTPPTATGASETDTVMPVEGIVMTRPSTPCPLSSTSMNGA